jgi:ABC-type uncharacterized transport system permease subunit
MANNLVLGLTALLALLPASLLPYRRRGGGRDMVFWALLAVALAGPAVYSLVQLGGPWKTGLAMALWLSIAISLAIFAGLAALTREGWRLMPLLLPYLTVLALIAVVWGQVPERHPLAAAPEAWLVVHILASLGTYGLATVAAVAGAAVFLQERALKRKQPTSLTGLLPSIAGGEALELRLLAAAELVLGLGIVTGMALQVLTTDRLLLFDHKTLLSLLAFAVIGALLILRHRSGLRGRRAARLVLLAYLLLTLAYPGVKFVTDVLLG